MCDFYNKNTKSGKFMGSINCRITCEFSWKGFDCYFHGK